MNSLLLKEQLVDALSPPKFDLHFALNALDMGILLLDLRAHIVFTNQRAQAILASAKGLLVQSSGQMAIEGLPSVELQHMLHRVMESGQGESLKAYDADREVCHYLTISRLRPLAAIGFSADPRLMVQVSSPGHQRVVTVKQLMQLFELTPAEARLAQSLASGHDLAHCQTLHGTRPSTLKTQLQSVLRKTGTFRQRDLVRLLAALPSGR